MFRNYLKIALRNFSRNPLYTFINSLGLVLGLTCSLLILLWVNFERTVDRFHPDGDRLYRAYFNGVSDAGEITFTQGAAPYALYTLLNEYEGVENAAFFEDGEEVMMQYEDNILKADGAWGSTSVFEVFDFPMIIGGLEVAEQELFTAFISDELARKLIGDDWQEKSIGAGVKINDQNTITIAGVYKKMGKNSSLQFDFLANAAAKAEARPGWAHSWSVKGATVYARLAPGVLPESVADYVNPIYEQTDGYGVGGEAMMLFPFEDNYLWTKFEQGIATGGRIQYLRIFSGAAIFLILIACVNFINLSTAQSASRAKEVGIRKTVGAFQTNLILQFLLETGVLVLIALTTALGLTHYLLPYMNDFTQLVIRIPWEQLSFWASILALAVTLTLTAGLYPAFVLSVFKPAKVLKSGPVTNRSNTLLRKSLVVFQFSLSAILIISTITVHRQLDLIQNDHLGLDRENVLSLEMPAAVKAKYEVLKEKLLSDPGVATVLRTTHTPVNIQWINVGFEWEGKQENQSNYFYMLNTEAGFAGAFDIEMVDGRFFDPDIRSDTAAVVLNETGAAQLGLNAPVGKTIRSTDMNYPYRIVGVAKDFPFASLHNKIEPLMIRYAPEDTYMMLVKLKAGSTTAGVDHLKKAWSEVFPNYPLDFEFLDDTFNSMYRGEVIIGRLAYLFATIAIVVSCLGLFGLITFVASQKTKEIGIRKVLGASVASIVRLLSQGFLRLVFISLLIATPIAWYFMKLWLQNFAFQIDLGWWIFALAALIVMFISLLTVSYQSLQAALVNPARSLKTE